MTLANAIAAWRALPAKHRKMIAAYFLAEAEQSREWATEAPLFGSARSNIAEAKAFEIAIALLKAAEKPAAKRRVGR